jgi:hypothetical protein
MSIPTQQAGEKALADAFRDYMHMVDSGHTFTEEQKNTGLFSYILTGKQRDRINKICNSKGWGNNQSKGVTIKISTLSHVLKARKGKDSLTVDECAEVLIAAYNKKSEVAENKGRDRQAIILNTKTKLTVQAANTYGVVILDASNNNLAQITAYHAHWAKVKYMTGR